MKRRRGLSLGVEEDGKEPLTVALLLALVVVVYLATVGAFGMTLVEVIDGVMRRVPS